MSSTDLIHIPEPLLPMSTDQAAAAMTAYQELTAKLLTAEDWQGIPGRNHSFVKRRGWAKLATFYGVSTELRQIDLDRDDTGALLRARVIARATHPGGRYAEGDGACATTEPRFASPAGRQKVEHDLPATAATRAVNRAISNLIGFGEVSAEEMDGDPPPAAAAPEPPAPVLLTQTAVADVIASLEEAWPGAEADRFIPILERRLEAGGIPEAAGRALKGWAWWCTQPAENAPPDPAQSAYHNPPEDQP